MPKSNKALNLIKLIKTLIKIWAYTSIIVFVKYSTSIIKAGAVLEGILILLVCLIYCIANTIMIIFTWKKQEDKNKVKGCKIVLKSSKLILEIISILFIVGILNKSLEISSVWKVIHIIWVSITLFLDIMMLIISKTVKNLKKKLLKKE